MIHRHALAGLALVGALAALPACASKSKPEDSGSDAASESSAQGYYAEEYKDGRFYVFGQKETHDAWSASGHMPYTRTFIGAGPGGRTVVLEVDKSDDALADRLQAEFARRHGLRK